MQKNNPQIKCLIYNNPTLDAEANLDEFLIRNLEEHGKTLEIVDRVQFVNSITSELFDILANSKAIYLEISKILQELKPDCE